MSAYVLLAGGVATAMASGGGNEATAIATGVISGAAGPIGNQLFAREEHNQSVRDAFEYTISNRDLVDASAQAIVATIHKAAKVWEGEPAENEAKKLASASMQHWLEIITAGDHRFTPLWNESLPEYLVRRLAGEKPGSDIELPVWLAFLNEAGAQLSQPPVLNELERNQIAGCLARDFPIRLYDVLKQDLELGGAAFGGTVLRLFGTFLRQLERMPKREEFEDLRTALVHQVDTLASALLSRFEGIRTSLNDQNSRLATECGTGRLYLLRINARIEGGIQVANASLGALRDTTKTMVSQLALSNALLGGIARSHSTMRLHAIDGWTEKVRLYGTSCERLYSELKLSALGGTLDDQKRLTLDDLFVQPLVRTEYPELLYSSRANAVKPKHAVSQTEHNPMKEKITIGDVLLALEDTTCKRHVLLGAAGSGKSSVFRHIYCRWLKTYYSERAAGRNGIKAGAVPILIEIREFLSARGRAIKGALHGPIGDLIEYITLPCGRSWHFERGELLSALKAGRAILLIDGLDEAFDESTRSELAEWIRTFGDKHPKIRIYVSSRSNGFDERPWRQAKEGSGRVLWNVHSILEFDDERVTRFLNEWLRHMVHASGEREQKKQEIMAAIHGRSHLMPLVRVPLTLTMLCAVVQRGSRPDDRVALYQKAVEIFLEAWDNTHGLPKEDAEVVRQFSELGMRGRNACFLRIAEEMSKQGTPHSSNQITRTTLESIFHLEFAEKRSNSPRSLAQQMCRLVYERNFLLTVRDSETFAFFHRSFLEYFTALAWKTRWDALLERNVSDFFQTTYKPRCWEATWTETLHFFTALLGAEHAAKFLPLIPLGCEGLKRVRALEMAIEFAKSLSTIDETRRALDPLKPQLLETTARSTGTDEALNTTDIRAFCQIAKTIGELWRDDPNLEEALLNRASDYFLDDTYVNIVGGAIHALASDGIDIWKKLVGRLRAGAIESNGTIQACRIIARSCDKIALLWDQLFDLILQRDSERAPCLQPGKCRRILLARLFQKPPIQFHRMRDLETIASGGTSKGNWFEPESDVRRLASQLLSKSWEWLV